LGDEGAVQLAHGIARNQGLAKLSLQYNEIGAVGGRALLEAIVGMNTTLAAAYLERQGNTTLTPELISAIQSAVRPEERQGRAAKRGATH